MRNRGTKEEIAAAWKALDAVLEERDAALLETLRRGKQKKDYWDTVTAWFKAHDGQSPGAPPIFDGFRLLSGDESDAAEKKFRGAMYRRDWNDEWVTIGESGMALLCWDPAKDYVWIVDVATRPYVKRKRCQHIVQWLQLAAKSA